MQKAFLRENQNSKRRMHKKVASALRKIREMKFYSRELKKQTDLWSTKLTEFGFIHLGHSRRAAQEDASLECLCVSQSSRLWGQRL